MDEPAKPFACTIPDCGMSFTNEDHLHVHTKKHDMVLQLGLEQKGAFVADQTPTPTRFIRNCEEVGLFQDLQNVSANPFDEGFKRAMETKAGILSLENGIAQSTDDVLHTPQMVFPLLDTAESTLYTNNQKNVTISRSSSDESGTIKEFETRTISKLTNEVTTISRIVNEDITIKQSDRQSDIQTVSYKNNVITIESNVIRKDESNKVPILVYAEPSRKVFDAPKDDSSTDKTKLNVEKAPIMSQKSLDFVVDSLTSELDSSVDQILHDKGNVKESSNLNINQLPIRNKLIDALIRNEQNVMKSNKLPKILPNNTLKELNNDDFEVTIKLPDGKQVRMKPVEERIEEKTAVISKVNSKCIIRNRIANKVTPKKNVLLVNAAVAAPQVSIPSGTLIPVTLLSPEGTPLSHDALNNVPITKVNNVNEIANLKAGNSVKITTVPPVLIKRKPRSVVNSPAKQQKVAEKDRTNNGTTVTQEDIVKAIESQNRLRTETAEDDDVCIIEGVTDNPEQVTRTKWELEHRNAASKRYREKLKKTMQAQSEENKKLREANQRLIAEKAVLKLLITEHMKKCPNASEIAQRMNLIMNGNYNI